MDTDTVKFRRPHLTKDQRLPRCYKAVEKILTKVKNCEGNVKTIIHDSNIRRSLFRKVYGLTFNVLKQNHILNSIIEKTKLLESEPHMKKELVGILIYEMIFGKGLPGDSKQVQIMKKYQVNIQDVYRNLSADKKFCEGLHSIPKYVRVNTLITTLPEVLEDLEYLGVSQMSYNDNTSEEEYFELVKNIEKNTFLVDYHFKDLLVFHSEENLTSWSLYQKGYVFIQDKSSYIPAHVLNPEPGASVIDACAAPGMKTLHLTSIMGNKGVLYAFERDCRRFEILKSMLDSGKVDICQAFCQDFNLVDPRDEKFSTVEYILLDPSCSGSGMVSRMDSVTDTEDSKNEARIQKLAGFQIILLKHALLFPSVKRVVYSTCSTTETENEFVIQEVLAHFYNRFRLVPVLPDWSIRGSENFEFGRLCLRAFPDKTFTNGFFVAMFERIEMNEYSSRGKDRKHKKKKHAKEFSSDNLKKEENHVSVNSDQEKLCSFEYEKSFKHSKNKTNCEDEVPIKEIETHFDNEEYSLEAGSKKKSHKKRKKQKENDTEGTNEQYYDYVKEIKQGVDFEHTNHSDGLKNKFFNYHSANLERGKVSSSKNEKSFKHSKNKTNCEERILVKEEVDNHFVNEESCFEIENKKSHKKKKKHKRNYTEGIEEHYNNNEIQRIKQDHSDNPAHSNNLKNEIFHGAHELTALDVPTDTHHKSKKKKSKKSSK